jgi:HK97 family phage portal protein
MLRNRAPVPLASRMLQLPLFHPNTAETQMRAYGAVGTLFAIVHRLSEATSQVDWHLYRTTSDGRRRYEGEETRTEVTRHAALDLWTRPNPWQTRQEFVEATEQHLELTGEGWWVVARDERFPAAGPLELWGVRPDRMTPVPHRTRFLSGYVYTGPDGEQVPLQLDEVIQIKLPNPLDPYRGLGPVQAVLVDLDAARYSAEWNRNFFLNSAEPGGIIEAPDKLTDDEFTEFTERWREQHQGVSGAHRVAILEKMKWVDRSISQRDMQFVELRKVAREVIREAFGIHGHMIGQSENVNKANAEAADTGFGKWMLRPRLGRIKGALNARLLPMFGATTTGLEFDHADPEPPDRQANDRERTSKASAFKTLVDAGVDPDDAAMLCGWPEVKMAEAAAAGSAGGGDGASAPATPRELTEMVQKVYLGVGKVITWQEARDILNRAGADLGDQPQPTAPAPAAPEPEPASAAP